jgi:ketosteroid isomerase-like protein
MDRRDPVEGYYEAIDAGDYDRLRRLLDPGFSQERPDRTLDGREAFVRFMREERPRTDTEHTIDEMCVGDSATADGVTVFAEGRLRTTDGDELFGFVDVHRLADGRIRSLTTYTV